MDIYDIFKKTVAFLLKKQGTGFINFKEFSDASETAQLYIIDDLFKDAEGNQEIIDGLRLLKVQLFEEVPLNGKYTVPDDYRHLLIVNAIDSVDDYCNGTEFGEGVGYHVQVKKLKENQKGNALQNSKYAPTKDYPVLFQYNGYMELYPKNIGMIEFIYIKNPPKPVLAATIVANREVYDTVNSVQFSLPDSLENDLIEKIVEILSIHAQDQMALQYSQMNKRQ
jgi:hypothetical protein